MMAHTIVFQGETGGDIDFSFDISATAVSGYVVAVAQDQSAYWLQGTIDIVGNDKLIISKGMFSAMPAGHYIILPQVVDDAGLVYFLDETEIDVGYVPGATSYTTTLPSIFERVSDIEATIASGLGVSDYNDLENLPDLSIYAQKAAENTFTQPQIIISPDGSTVPLSVKSANDQTAHLLEAFDKDGYSTFHITRDGFIGIGVDSNNYDDGFGDPARYPIDLRFTLDYDPDPTGIGYAEVLGFHEILHVAMPSGTPGSYYSTYGGSISVVVDDTAFAAQDVEGLDVFVNSTSLETIDYMIGQYVSINAYRDDTSARHINNAYGLTVNAMGYGGEGLTVDTIRGIHIGGGSNAIVTERIGLNIDDQRTNTTNPWAIYTRGGNVKFENADTITFNGKGIFSKTYTTSTGDAIRGVQVSLTGNYASGDNFGEQTGVYFETFLDASSTVRPDNLLGLFGAINNPSTLKVPFGAGASFLANANGTGGFDQLVGVQAAFGFGSGTDVDTAQGIYIPDTNASAASVDTLVGIDIGNMSGAGANYALRTHNGKVLLGDNTQISKHAAIGLNSAVDDGSLFYSGNSYKSILSLQEEFTDFSTDYIEGITMYMRANPSANVSNGIYGIDLEMETAIGNTKDFAALNGVYSYISHNGTGTLVTAQAGVFGINNVNTGIMSDAEGVAVYFDNAGTVTNGYGVHVNMPVQGSATNLFGIKVENVACATNAYALYTGTGKIRFGDEVILTGALTLPVKNANKVFAGPTTGADATPTFRSLVAADIPNIAESQVTNLTVDLAAKLAKASNLSDVTSVSTARTNLDVPSNAQAVAYALIFG